MAIERITKLDAARRQMNEAIQLFFERRDNISIHALAAAASQVLSDLCKSQGIVSLIRGAGIIREDKRKEWLAAFKKAENFFKHADRDPQETLDFNPGLTNVVLFDCTYLYACLTKRQTYEGVTFQSWFYLKYPTVLLDESLKKRLLDQSKKLNVTIGDWDFFRDLLRFKQQVPADARALFD